MEGDKDAYYVVHKGDVFGFYRTAKELLTHPGRFVSAQSFCFPFTCVYVRVLYICIIWDSEATHQEHDFGVYPFW